MFDCPTGKYVQQILDSVKYTHQMAKVEDVVTLGQIVGDLISVIELQQHQIQRLEEARKCDQSKN